MSTDIDEQLIGQLVLTEDSVATSIGTIIKSVAAADRLDEFKAAIERFANQKQLEVDGICNNNYRSFFKCLEWQQAFKEDIKRMSDNVHELRSHLSESGELILLKKTMRLELLELQLNLDHCIEACDNSLSAFNLAQMAALHILDRKFEDALRQLDALSKQIRAIEEFSFVQQLSISNELL